MSQANIKVKPKLIFGLGNPGREYANTRHNIGFMMLDTLAREWDATWHEKPRFKALIAEATIDSQKVILAKPSTYYNLAGESARAICDFYKLEASDILVIHDELDLPFGTIRTRVGGSDAGNNGIRSLTAHLGEDFARMRVGIANEQLPVIGAHDFVLGMLDTAELRLIEQLAEYCKTQARQFVHDGLSHASHHVLRWTL